MVHRRSATSALLNVNRTAEETASQHASRWVMIPLTRAIDTLVINIAAKPGFVADALRRVHEKRRDFVDWVVLA